MERYQTDQEGRNATGSTPPLASCTGKIETQAIAARPRNVAVNDHSYLAAELQPWPIAQEHFTGLITLV